MPSLLYNKIIHATALASVNFVTSSFKVMLVTNAYTPDRDTHNFRSDVTDEVVGAGYTAGGSAISAVVNRDDALDQTTVTFGEVEWPEAALTARAAVIYVSRGGSAAADELVAYVDFGADKTSAGETFVFKPTTPLRMINQSV